jgi:hypothetical protein
MSKKKINIKASNEDLKGNYSNLVRVVNKKEELILDFLLTTGDSGILSSRVIVSPNHLKRIVEVLEDSLEKYEKKFEDIEEEDSKKVIGFTK